MYGIPLEPTADGGLMPRDATDRFAVKQSVIEASYGIGLIGFLKDTPQYRDLHLPPGCTIRCLNWL